MLTILSLAAILTRNEKARQESADRNVRGGLLTAAVLSSVSLGFSTYLIEPIREAGVPASLQVGEVVDAFKVVPEESAGFSLCRDGFLSDSQIYETEMIAFDVICDPLLRDEAFLTNGYLRVNLQLTETGGNLISSGTVSFEPLVDGSAAGTAETSGASLLVAGVELDIASRLEFEVSFRLSIPDLASYQNNFESQLDAAPRFALGLERSTDEKALAGPRLPSYGIYRPRRWRGRLRFRERRP